MLEATAAFTVTVLIPVRNAAPTLMPTLESLKAQTFRDFIIVVVDDGSTDATMDILRAYQKDEPRLHLLKNAGRGISAALNTGLRHIDSPFVARLDADDLAMPRRLRTQVAALRHNSDWVLCGSDVERIDAIGTPRGVLTSPTTPEAIAKRLHEKNCLYHPSIMFRSEAVKRLGGYRSRFDGAEDYDLYLRLSRLWQLGSLPEALTQYRIHDGQVTADPNRRYRLIADAVLLNTLRREANLMEFQNLPADDLPLFLVSEVISALGRTKAPLKPRIARHILARCKRAGADITLAKRALVRATLAGRVFQETIKALAL
ncbi:glycosyltransferase family 2 protein [Pseudovibrio exalbescens]|uniref:glycosyltransferase family 2 protein n=1 Tax=Pseudovibrio exalbescens TaxID=197461 RepID=UPI0015E11C33|nr:glycosyltransferase family A protein [Pseudovibrio exalbescens]